VATLSRLQHQHVVRYYQVSAFFVLDFFLYNFSSMLLILEFFLKLVFVILLP
jgi:hypothetical protein